MACINCKNIFNCGTVKRYIKDFSKTGLIKELNSDLEKCLDFEFEALDNAVLRLRISELNKLSQENKLRLKQAKNKELKKC